MTYRIITIECSECGTIIAGNILEEERVMTCPGLDCKETVQFENLPEEDREYILDNPGLYNLYD